MKNKYTGDINDYIKYGLLRSLGGGRMKCDICWMLTPDDDRGDGKLVHYTKRPDIWRRHDPDLFDTLSSWLDTSPRRSTAWVEKSGILPNARFYQQILSDSAEGRQKYFEGFNRMLRPGHLAFFDPDNGMPVRSTGKGRRGSSRYLWWDELRPVYDRGSSVLVYQHFPRVKRTAYIDARGREFRHQLQSVAVTAFASSRVVYFLCARPEHAAAFREKNEIVAARWDGILKVTEC
jgi:hypothetical protein